MPTLDSIITSDILADNAVEYFGIDGIRRAAIRFLGAVAASSKPQTLKLYSDQNLTWLSSDAEFVQKWSILMCLVLKNKNQIKIIHSIDRNFSEMLIGIEKWLPLYMSGMIEGYYCKNASDSRFCHTLFLAPETAAINQGVW